MAYTPMFDKLINTKPERELCIRFLEFLKGKGLLQGDINSEEPVAEFFGTDAEQTEEERKMLIKEFHEATAANDEQTENPEDKSKGEKKELGKESGRKADEEEPAAQETTPAEYRGVINDAETKNENVELNSHGVNAKIKARILDDAKMREIGFTDYAKDRWYFFRGINFKDVKKKIDISFSVTIPKDGSDIRIDVLAEWFCQPYDYQYILKKDPGHKIANIVKEQVEYWMEKLQEEGVLEGHVRGEYI